ncbi:MAG: bifunctional biotin--[acetyl-CoA-carboxylase] ligase/biotin operon repressor BirA [Gammaproteobacteria bacterium]
MDFTVVRKNLIRLLADGEFHSGSELSQSLGISRAAVWKQMSAIGDLGIGYSAVQGRGYRLDSPIELLDEASIRNSIDAGIHELVSAIEIHDVIDSTNNYLINQDRCGPGSGVICLAEYQTAGKGRRGRNWVSPFGNNIYLSVLWEYSCGPSALSGLSLAAGVAVIRALKRVVSDHFRLKWPNDIFWNFKKLGGILIEMTGGAEGPCRVVVGIGINLLLNPNKAKSIDQDWVDLTRITGGEVPSRNRLAGFLIGELMPVISNFENGGLDDYLDEWRDCDCLKDNPATVFAGSRQVTGVVRGIDHNGLLRLQLPDGNIRVFASGEVSFSPPV